MTVRLGPGTNDGDVAVYDAGSDSWVAQKTTSVVSKSADYPLAASDALCLVSGTTTITLPTAVGRKGKVYAVKNIGTDTVTITTTSSQTIDGATSAALPFQYTILGVVSDGANWQTL
jgi:hypothetical protein